MSEPSPELRATPGTIENANSGGKLRPRLRALLQRTPRKYLIALILALGLGIFALAVRSSAAAGSTNLKVSVQHNFRSADLTIWLDDQVAYQGKLTGTLRKRFGLIPAGAGGSFARTLRVASGKHVVRAQVSSPAEGYEELGRIEGDLPVNGEVGLAIAPHRHGLDLNWDGVSAAAVDAGPAWYVKYANSLLMTVAGSIVSALTAFLIRELPSLAKKGNPGAKA